MSSPLQHKYSHEQSVNVVVCEHGTTVPSKVLALLPHLCGTHKAPMYGCEVGGMHMTTCEEIMQPLSKADKRKMN